MCCFSRLKETLYLMFCVIYDNNLCLPSWFVKFTITKLYVSSNEETFASA